MNNPQTGKRLPTGSQNNRITTGMKQVNKEAVMSSVGYNTNLNIADRPVTNLGGLGGVDRSNVKTSSGRKIMDRYYYVNLFKKKINDIQKEIGNLKGEVEGINKDITDYHNLNKNYENISKDVQNLEGELADYNLASDKLRSNMRPEDIEAVFNHIKINNKKKRDESDILFLEKSKKLEEFHKIESEMNKIYQSLDQKLNDLDPEQKTEYDILREENQKYMANVQDLREEVSRINADIAEGENLLKNNPQKKEAHRIKEGNNQLMKRKEDLELQTNESGLSVEEMKQRLVNKYKEDTAEKQNIDRKINDVKKVIDNYKKSISEIEKELKANTQNESSKAQDSIFQKDKEYSTFIENFDEIKKSQLRELSNKEELVVALLENISEKINSKNNLPSKNEHLSLQKAIGDKDKMIEKSISTLEEARAQYERLQVASKRLSNIDETLKKEITNLTDKITNCKKEITEKFERIDAQKESLRQEDKKLSENIRFLERNNENYNKLLTSHVLKSRSKVNQLEEMESYKKLRELEKKIQENENTIYGISTYLESKSGETDYSHLMKECLELQNEINNELIKKTLSVNI